MTLATKTVKGIGWASFAQVVNQIIQFIVSAILARLLFPDDFGMIAMIVVFSNFLVIFQGMGMGASIIQEKNLDSDQINSIFWIATGSGLMLTLLMFILSPFIASFYKVPQLQNLAMVLGTTFFISSFGIVPSSLLSRDMKFKALSLINITTALFSGLLAIILALKGFGVWSLVYRQVFSSVLLSSLLLIVKKWKPSFIFHWKKVKGMFKFGANLTGFTFVNYFNRNLDNLLIGKFLGAQPLGYYNFSYNIMLFPINQISRVLGQVLFPALSKIQDDLPRLRYVYTKANFFISVITFPLMIGLFVLAPEFVRAILGSKWNNAIPIIKILSLVALRQSIGTTTGWIYLVRGRTDVMLKWGIYALAVISTGFAIGLHWGIIGVALAYLICVYVFLALPGTYIALRLINLNIWKFFQEFAPTFFASVIMGVVVFLLKHFLIVFKYSDWFILILCTFVGFVIYALLLWLSKRDVYTEIISYMKMAVSGE